MVKYVTGAGEPPAKPFKPGNTEAVKHGGYTRRVWGELAERLEAELHQVAPWASSPAFAPAIAAWARAEAQLSVVSDWLDEHDQLDDEGVPRPAVELQIKLAREAAARRSELGLNPSALSRLLGSFATLAGASVGGDGVKALRREGARILDARRAQLDSGDDGDDEDLDPSGDAA